MKKKTKLIPQGTLRIKTRDLKVYVREKNSWKKSSVKFPDALHVSELFKAHNNFDILVDKKNPEFLKGQQSKDGKTQGARINVLPDGRKLNSAFSLFGKNLTIHDETSNIHWDVIYQNPCGTFSYVYTLEKKDKSVKHKYKVVEEFGKNYEKILNNVLANLTNRKDDLALPVYTLLVTRMRVGNEIYYKAHGHKGLTTLTKKDITIKDSKVSFKYLSKGGVPRKISEDFPKEYIKRLKALLKPLKKNDFAFVNKKTGHPLKDTDFEKAFKRYCGTAFYPHIVRSYYATQRAHEFLETHKSASKKEINSLFLSIAEKLGHKRFVKKKQMWEDNYTVTIHHYIQPELVQKLKNSILK